MDILPFLRQRAGDFTCPRCRYSLADCGVRILQQRGPVYTVQVTCRRCDLSLLVQLQLQGDAGTAEAIAAGGRSPRASAPGRRASRAPRPPSEPAMPPITADELLDLHLHLADFSGALTALWPAPVPEAAPETAH
ncbi:MAG TPA: hypothetical protein VMW47_13810 [Verrucomicrobiae bacterium]|nr:hypothetical protein [Verrucomicrobiae bacterium]